MVFVNPNAARAFFTPRFAGGGNFCVQNNTFYNTRVINQFNTVPVGGYWQCPGNFRRECYERAFHPDWKFALGAMLGGAAYAYQASRYGAYYPPAAPVYTPYAYSPPAYTPAVYAPPPAQAGLPADAENKYEYYRGNAMQGGKTWVAQALDQLVQDPNFRAMADPAAQDEAMRYLVDNPAMVTRLQVAMGQAAQTGRLPLLGQALRDPQFQQQIRALSVPGPDGRIPGPEFAVAMLQGPPPGSPPPGTLPPTTAA